MPMRCPSQMGVKQIDGFDAGSQRRLDPRPRHRRRRLRIVRYRLMPRHEGPEAIQRLAERIDDTSPPAVIGTRARIADDEGRHADDRVDPTIEGFDRDAAIVDANDLADLGPVLSGEPDPIPELHELGQSRNAIIARTDLADRAADPDPALPCRFGQDEFLKLLESVHRCHQELGPRVRMASMRVDSLS